MKQIRILLIGLIGWVPVSAQQSTTTLYRAQKAVTDVIVHDIFSPPVASRIYLYASLAAYETLAVCNQMSSFRKIRPDFPSVPMTGSVRSVDPELTSLYAFVYTASRYVFSDSALLDSLSVMVASYQTHSRFAASVGLAKQVSDSVFSWSKTDGYATTRKLRRYALSRSASSWKPTPPGYISAVEPYWGRMRTVMIDTLEHFRPAAALSFSSDSASAFYREAREVYEWSKQMRHEDSLKALFWDCNPFYINTQGHLAFATKKLSPGGHWMSIAGLVSAQQRVNFISAVQAYFYTAIALYDAFISCWDEKYRSNLIRPETYINTYIDQSWRPLLQTPPFPEYTSGHSVISAAAATVLTAFFGRDLAFDDYTETGYGLPVRHFHSFEAAAAEAAISRMYGGIHYRSAVENGLEQGRKIGKAIVKKIDLQAWRSGGR
jgi:hypothetical protein